MQKFTPERLLDKYGQYISPMYYSMIKGFSDEELDKLRKVINLSVYRARHVTPQRKPSFPVSKLISPHLERKMYEKRKSTNS